MGKFTRIPADTFEQIQTEAGILLYKFDTDNPGSVKDEDIICPTTGGITASCVPSYSDMGEDVDNCPANLLELKNLDSWECTLEFTSLGTSPKSIRLALGAADIDSNKPSKIIPRRNLKTTDASDVWWVGDRADGGMVAVCLKRALSTSGFSLQTTKSGKGQTSVTLTGHTTVDTQDEVPMEFYSEGPAPASMESLTTRVGVGDKTVGDFVEDGTYIDWEGIDGVVEGTLKHVTGYTEFSSSDNEQSGNYFYIKLDSKYDGEEITCIGTQTKKANDLEWVLRVEKTKKFTFKANGETIATLDFSKATLSRAV